MDNENSRCSQCHQIRLRKRLVQCNDCSRWFHLSCVGLTRNQADNLPRWLCGGCRGIVPIEAACPIISDINDPYYFNFLAKCRSKIKVLPKVPKGALIPVANALETLIRKVLDQQSLLNWTRLMCFPYMGLRKPSTESDNTGNRSLSTLVRRQVADFLERGDIPGIPELPTVNHRKTTRTEEEINKNIRKRVTAKIMDGDIRGAVRELSSEEEQAPRTEETLAALLDKHPQCPDDLDLPLPPDDNLDSPKIASEEEVMKSINSFRPGSAGGPDGLKPGHLKSLVGRGSGEAGARLLGTLTEYINMILRGEVLEAVCPFLFGASLCALSKKDGGIRPIAVGNTIRRLATKICAAPLAAALGDQLRPKQLGFSTRGGCEAAAHAARNYLAQPPQNRVFLKIDMKNAFNCLRRDTFLQAARMRAQSIYRLLWQAYSTPSILLFGEEIISSSSGIQQGDPFGPALFSLGIDSIVQHIDCELNVWYLDDASIADSPDKVLSSLRDIIRNLEGVGLSLNDNKCELTLLNHESPQHESDTLDLFREILILPNIKVVAPQELSLLGAPLSSDNVADAVRGKRRDLERMVARLELIDPHQAFTLLKNCFSIPKLQYVLRASPAYKCHEDLLAFDAALQSAVSRITNVVFGEGSWKQAILPVSYGGIGIRCASDIALPAFISSMYSVGDLASTVLSTVPGVVMAGELAEAEEEWKTYADVVVLPEEHLRSRQKVWDSAATSTKLDAMLQVADQVTRARLLAASRPESGLWLHAMPVSFLGTQLDPESLRVAIALRIGAKICEPHKCRCGQMMDTLGLHGLSCRYSAGRFPRHSALNDIVKRSLQVAGLPSLLEPVGIDRGDGRRPDGITVFPFKNGRSLCWDCTCSDTFSATHLNQSAMCAGAAARAAEDRKRTKYEGLRERFQFEPIAIETTGVYGTSTEILVSEIGRRLCEATGDQRETLWLKQRLGLAVQRGNAFSILFAQRDGNLA